MLKIFISLLSER